MYLRGGTYLINAASVMSDNVVVALAPDTIVRVAAGTTMNGAVFQATNRKGCGVTGGEIDLNKANTTDPGNDTAGAGVYFASTSTTGTKRCWVSRVYVHDGHRIGIYVGSSGATFPNEVTVEDCTITGCTKRGIWGTYASRLVLRGNTLTGNCTSDAGGGQIQVNNGSNVTVEGNTANGAPAGLHHGMAFAFVDSLRVVGNIANSNSTDTGGTNDGSGIVISEDCVNVTVAANTCKSNGAMGITLDVATAASATVKTTIATITGNTCSSNGSHGIYSQYGKGVAVTGNTCLSNNGSGIFLVTQENIVEGNVCGLNTGFGIGLDDDAVMGVSMGNNTIGTNHLYGNTAGSLSDLTVLSNVYGSTVPISTKTASYTLAFVDAGTVVRMNSASAQVFTVPPNSSVAFPVGTSVELMRYGAGTVTITPGSGVTIPNSVQVAGTASRTITGQMLSATVLKVATNEWILSGSIA